MSVPIEMSGRVTYQRVLQHCILVIQFTDELNKIRVPCLDSLHMLSSHKLIYIFASVALSCDNTSRRGCLHCHTGKEKT